MGADFGVRASLDELVAKVGTAVDLGYRRVKLKARPGWDSAVVGLIRRRSSRTSFSTSTATVVTLSPTLTCSSSLMTRD